MAMISPSKRIDVALQHVRVAVVAEHLVEEGVVLFVARVDAAADPAVVRGSVLRRSHLGHLGEHVVSRSAVFGHSPQHFVAVGIRIEAHQRNVSQRRCHSWRRQIVSQA
jgi:hypothetical protein